MLVLCWLSIVLIDFFGPSTMLEGKAWYFVVNCNKILAVGLALSSFLFFLNWRLPYIPAVNKIASATFGVLLVHSNSDLMRKFVWQDLLRCTYFYGTKYVYLHAVLSVIGVFAVGTVIELLRLRLVDEPLFRYLDKKWRKT